MFARFEEKPKFVDTDVVDDSGIGFVSPDAVKFSSGSSKRGFVSYAASKTKVINLDDDLDFVQEVKKVEGRIDGDMQKGDSIKGVDDSGLSFGTDT